MRLKNLEIQGFKSFPDKLNIAFSEGITAIVGPNGSGKSNISDAIRWVLGEQGVKSLRGTKMEDVVFSGTEKRGAMGFAQVTLTLDNTSGVLPLPFGEVAITRKYYKSGESEYYINKSRVRLKDVRELFMDTGLGREGYSVIGQGKIGEILSAKDEDLRNIFEEAAGITKYRYKKEEAERKLEGTELNLERLRDNLFSLEERIGPLKEQSDKALLYKDLKEQLKKSEILFSLKKLDSLEKAREKARADEESARGNFESTKSEMEEKYERAEENSEAIRRLFLEGEDAKQKLSAERELLSEKQHEIAVLRTEIKSLSENKDRLLKEIEAEGLKNEETKREIEETRSAKEGFSETLSLVSNEIGALTEKAAILKEAEAESERRAAEEKTAAELLSYRLSAIGEKKTELGGQISGLLRRNEELKAILLSRESEKEKRKERAQEGEKILAELEEELISLGNKQKGVLIKKEVLARQVSEEEGRISSCEKEYALLSARYKALSDTESAFEGYSLSVKTVMQKVKSGGLSNIYGTLSSVIEVADEYATAIEVALGGALSNIVTATDRDAKNAIDYLKIENKGRATFLPASAMKGRKLDLSGVKGTPGFVALASDVVTSDGKFQGIIENLLGRTVIAENLEHALSISKKHAQSFRLVTLDGQIINTSGAMTGGSYQKDAGLLHRKNELAALKVKTAALAEIIEKLKGAIKAPKISLENAEIELTRLKDEHRKTESEIEKTKALIGHLLEELALMASGDGAFLGETEQNKGKILSFESAIEELEREKEKLAQKSAAAEEKIALLLSEKERATALVLAQQEEIAAREKDRIIAKKDVESCDEKLETLSARLFVRDQRKEEKESEMLALSNAIAAHEQKIAALLQETEEIAQKIPSGEEKIRAVEKERTSLEEQSAALRRGEKDLSETLMNLQKVLTLSEGKLEGIKRDYDAILDHLWEEYEITYNGMISLKESGALEGQKGDGQTIASLTSRIRALGDVNLSSIEEYQSVSERYESLSAQIADLENAKKEIERVIAEVTKKMRFMFEESFLITKEAFSKAFTELFGGGRADVLLLDPSEILESRIEIKVHPPGKNVRSMSLLSGGEQALTAIALLFAMISVRPTPFCVFDEIESSLDDVNITRFVRYIEKFENDVQFILITHRRGTMEAADILYGVTMQERGVSSLLSINVRDLEKGILTKK